MDSERREPEGSATHGSFSTSARTKKVYREHLARDDTGFAVSILPCECARSAQRLTLPQAAGVALACGATRRGRYTVVASTPPSTTIC